MSKDGYMGTGQKDLLDVVTLSAVELWLIEKGETKAAKLVEELRRTLSREILKAVGL